MKYFDSVNRLLDQVKAAGMQPVLLLPRVTDHLHWYQRLAPEYYPDLKDLTDEDVIEKLTEEGGKQNAPTITGRELCIPEEEDLSKWYNDRMRPLDEVIKAIGLDAAQVVVCCDHHVPKHMRYDGWYDDKEVEVIKRRVTFAFLCPCCVPGDCEDYEEEAYLREEGFKIFHASGS